MVRDVPGACGKSNGKICFLGAPCRRVPVTCARPSPSQFCTVARWRQPERFAACTDFSHYAEILSPDGDYRARKGGGRSTPALGNLMSRGLLRTLCLSSHSTCHRPA